MQEKSIFAVTHRCKLNFSEGYTTLSRNQRVSVLPDPCLKEGVLNIDLLAIPMVTGRRHQEGLATGTRGG
jgi:hypothetical protein